MSFFAGQQIQHAHATTNGSSSTFTAEGLAVGDCQSENCEDLDLETLIAEARNDSRNVAENECEGDAYLVGLVSLTVECQTCDNRDTQFKANVKGTWEWTCDPDEIDPDPDSCPDAFTINTEILGDCEYDECGDWDSSEYTDRASEWADKAAQAVCGKEGCEAKKEKTIHLGVNCYECELRYLDGELRFEGYRPGGEVKRIYKCVEG